MSSVVVHDFINFRETKLHPGDLVSILQWRQFHTLHAQEADILADSTIEYCIFLGQKQNIFTPDLLYYSITLNGVIIACVGHDYVRLIQRND